MTPTERQTSKALSAVGRAGRTALMLATALPILGGVLLLWQAWTLSHVLGQAIEAGTPLDALAPSIGLILALLIVRAALSALGERAGVTGAEQIKANLRALLFSHLLARSPRRAEQPQSGAAAASIIDQVDALDGYFARYLPAMVQASLLPLAFAIVILPLDWVAGLLFLVTAPLIPVFMALAGWGAQLATDRQARALSLLSGRFADRLRGITTLKLFGRAQAETESIVVASEALRRRTLRVLRIAFLSSAVLEFFAALGVAGVALYVGLNFIDYLQFRATPLTLQLGLFLLLMAPEVYNPLRLLAAHYHDRAAANAALREIERLLGPLPASAAPLPHLSTTGPRGSVSLSLVAVTVRTPDNSRVIVQQADLTVSAGEHIAILGPSGIGKSTLLEAITRFRPYEGDMTLDGASLDQWPEAQLRQRVVLLGQKPRIFAGSMADNIAIARPDASAPDIRRAAEMAQVAPFADALPQGLDTLLGEGGLGISGGQAQRIALARIFLRDAGLILLDEPTAHLDSALEHLVLDTIERFAQGRTLIVATHSLAVAARMDRAYRMVGGRLLPLIIGGKPKRSVA